MKRRELFKKLFGGMAAIAAVTIMPLSSFKDSTIESDDDQLDRLVEAGEFIQNKAFKLNRSHYFNEKPVYFNRCMFYSDSESTITIFANQDSIITKNVFDGVGLKYEMTHIGVTTT